jgi:spermidine synthase
VASSDPPSERRSVALQDEQGAGVEAGNEPPSAARRAWLLASIFIVSACAITYELLVGAVASYLLGNSVKQFSLTIGVFLASMGIGAYLSQWVRTRILERFIAVELCLSAIGGFSGWLLFAAFTYTDLYYLVMFGLIVVIGSLIGLELPLLTRYLRRFGTLRTSIARVFSLDYLGALVASVVFPLVLLPYLGVFRTSLAVGLLNAAVALATAWLFARTLRGSRRLALAGAAIVLVLSVAAARARQVASQLEKELYQDTIIYSEESPYQRLVLTRHGDDLRLYLNGSLQFSSRDEYRYHESLVHPAMTAASSHGRVLVIGGGDGLGVREVLKHDGVETVVLVDLDPAVTRLAREHVALTQANGDSLADPRVELVHADGYQYLRESPERFGVVLVDLPDPQREELAKLYSVSFYHLVRQHLAPGGVAATQATSPLFSREAFWCIVASAEAAGLLAVPYHAYVPSFGDWGFVAMSERPLHLGSLHIDVPTRFVESQLLATLTRFSPDTAPLDVDPSTLDRPIVLEYYDRARGRWF